MPHQSFVAFASQDAFLAEAIRDACRDIKKNGVEFVCWNMNDVSGQPIGSTVYGWVEEADSLIADISEPNHNVTYEIGLAIGMGKPLRLIKSDNKDWTKVQEIGLLHNIGHDSYSTQAALRGILEKGSPPTAPWSLGKKNREAPIYLLQSSETDDVLSRVTSGIKKIVKQKFRSFNPREIDRLTALEAVTQISASFGVVAMWHLPDQKEAFRQNQRAAFSIGVARGLGLPYLLIAKEGNQLPLDLDEIAVRYISPSDVDRHFREFREELYEFEEEFVEARALDENMLESINCGDPAAENEAGELADYFLQTEQYRLTLRGDANVILGRKGSGKTAIFLQVRDNTRVKKENIVVDLAPENYQLIKLKEFVLDKLALGTRKEFIAAFWEYIVLLEIAYKLLEKDAKRAKFDSKVMQKYERLLEVYNSRVDTGSGDFSERLTRLADRIVSRFSSEGGDGQLSSGKVLEIVYGAEIRSLRDEIVSYLKIKGVVFFLFDNIDRFWSQTGFDDTDALIIVGLIEALQELKKRFRRADIDFEWATFIRSDVFEFVVKGMADYGKIAVVSTEWNDVELILAMFRTRVMRGLSDRNVAWRAVWENITVPTVKGRPILDFLVTASLMRPRYLIRLFETARRRAVTLHRDRIEEDDYIKALEELGWQVLEDVSRELTDIVPSAEDLLFELTSLGAKTTSSELKIRIGRRVEMSSVDAVIDVLIWTGCLGVEGPKGATYIGDCGFRRPFIRALMADEKNPILLHPTLASLIS